MTHSRRKTCGVCASQSPRREGVSLILRCSSTRLSVSVTGTARMAAPLLAATAKTLLISASVRQGRTASCTATNAASGFTSASALAIESPRSLPPSHSCTFMKARLAA